MISDVLADAVAKINRYLYSQEWRDTYTGQTRNELKALCTMMEVAKQRLDAPPETQRAEADHQRQHGIELVLWLCFIIPGLIYSLWRLSTRSPGCPSCGQPGMVNVNSPHGKLLAEKL